jgi:hypothetical protein
MTLIGISGKKYSGKDSVFNFIRQLYTPLLKVERIGFADALKEEVAREFKVTLEYLEEHKADFRLMLQAWGNGKRDIIDRNYWINKVVVELNYTHADIIVIPDVRYKNEADIINTLGGHLLRVNRMNGHTTDSHPSEIDLDDYKFQHVIQNDGTLDDLMNKTRSTIIKLIHA